ncbi:MAG TPA: hypothetical protein VFO53_15245 [Casimicrobiaceae bacterium]|nr:hypothetical protein [Casimicrobiaceae bacterium]
MPLFASFGVVDVGADELELDDELVSGDAGGVLALDDDVLGVDDGLDDIDPLDDEGGVVDEEDDVEGDGVTTGGVVPGVVDDSRLQPAMPSTSPVQSSVTNALFIAISR